MSVNLKNEKALNEYIARLIYHGGEPDTFTKANLKDIDFIKMEKDKIIRAMTYQWMKKNVREYLTDNESAVCLEKVESAEADDPKWLKDNLAEGKPIYIFDQTKVPNSLNSDLQKIIDYLYTVANNYIIKISAHKNPNITLGALKDRPEHKSFVLTLAQADKWHERIAAEALQKKVTEKEKLSLAAGTEFIMDLGDGFTAVRLMTEEALDKESDYMGHCVGRGGYDKGVKDGTIQIYSIRDANGEPHSTFEVREGKVLQCKGKANKAIVSKYVPYVQKFVMDYNLNPEADLKNMALCKDVNGNLHSIYNIPPGTELYSLDLSEMDFEKLPDLSKIKLNGQLNLSGCKNLKSLEGSPEILKELYCYNCATLTSLKGLSKGVERIDCVGCPLTSLEGLKEGLKELNCSVCGDVSGEGLSFEALPEGIEIINCSNSNVSSLKGIKRGLKKLNCSDCKDISFEGLPEGIEEIFCRNSSITSFKGIKEGLKKLNCSGCESSSGEELSFDGLPEGVETIECSDSTITSLEGIKKGLKDLFCSNCQGLTSLKGLPDGVENVDISRCSQILNLYGLPNSIKRLSCGACEKLVSFEGCSPEIEGIDTYPSCPAIKYIPDEIESSKICYMGEDKKRECKENWRALQQEKAKENATNNVSFVLKKGGER